MLKGKGLNTVVGITAGLAAGKMLNKVQFVAQNPMIGGAVKIGAGLFLSQGRGRSAFVKNLGYGVAATGATELVNSLAPGLGIGFLGAGGSTSVTQIAGRNGVARRKNKEGVYVSVA